MDKKFDGWPTTRCFPRSMREAFEDPIEMAQWWYPPVKVWHFWEITTWTLAGFLWLGLAYWYANT